MDPDLTKMIRELNDRQEIYDCLMRYCRGIDRLDHDLLASAYHPDAIDDHGMYVGPVAGFIEWVLPLYEQHKLTSQHEITNHYCELDGDMAHAESYFVSSSVNATAPFHSLARGRYIDRFERRNGRWAIAARICIVEVSDGANNPAGNSGGVPRKYSPRDKSDPSYMRPLTVDRSRFTT